jgi:hypothetical protein
VYDSSVTSNCAIATAVASRTSGVSTTLFVNESLVADGYAAPYRYPPNVKYADRFSALGATAHQGLGLWGVRWTNTPADGSSTAKTVVLTPVPRPARATPTTPARVPVSSTDLDCADVGVHGFQVVGSDPHRFDGNHDHVACE